MDKTQILKSAKNNAEKLRKILIFLLLGCFAREMYQAKACSIAFIIIFLIMIKTRRHRANFTEGNPPGGDSDMKWTGMLVVSLRGVNFGFWSRLGCSGQNVIIFNRQGLV